MKNSADNLHSWSLYISSICVIVVGLLNWEQGYVIEDLLIHVVIAFGLVYGLVEINIFLFEKSGILASFDGSIVEKPKSSFSITIEDKIELEKLYPHLKEFSDTKTDFQEVSGQIDPNLSLGLPNDQHRSDIRKKMGLPS